VEGKASEEVADVCYSHRDHEAREASKAAQKRARREREERGRREGAARGRERRAPERESIKA